MGEEIKKPKPLTINEKLDIILKNHTDMRKDVDSLMVKKETKDGLAVGQEVKGIMGQKFIKEGYLLDGMALSFDRNKDLVNRKEFFVELIKLMIRFRVYSVNVKLNKEW